VWHSTCYWVWFRRSHLPSRYSGGKDIAHTCIRQTLLIHLLVVSSTFSQSKEKDDGKGIATFHTFTKIGDKNYKVIVDCESCVNTVSSEVFGTDGLKSIPHSHLFKVPWIKFTALWVNQPCLVLINFHLYFWRTLWDMLGTKSKFSTAFQPQINGQTKVVITSLHDIIYGFRPRHPIYLIDMVDYYGACIIIKSLSLLHHLYHSTCTNLTRRSMII